MLQWDCYRVYEWYKIICLKIQLDRIFQNLTLKSTQVPNLFSVQPFYVLSIFNLASTRQNYLNYKNLFCRVFKKKNYIIWDIVDVSEKFISFCNQITWPIFIKMISNFNSMCTKNPKFYV